MFPESNYISFLDDLFISGPNIHMVALTDLSGTLKVMIKHPAYDTSLKTDDNHIFLGWAIAQAYIQIGSLYAFDYLSSVTIEYQNGTVLLTPIRTGLLITLTDKSASINFLRQKLHYFANMLTEHEYTQTTPPKNDSFNDLDAIEAKQPTIPPTRDDISHPKKDKVLNDKKIMKQAYDLLDDI